MFELYKLIKWNYETLHNEIIQQKLLLFTAINVYSLQHLTRNRKFTKQNYILMLVYINNASSFKAKNFRCFLSNVIKIYKCFFFQKNLVIFMYKNKYFLNSIKIKMFFQKSCIFRWKNYNWSKLDLGLVMLNSAKLG